MGMAMTAEQKWDAAMDRARIEPATSRLDGSPSLLALNDAADCADAAEGEGEAWYVFAVGVAAHDTRSAHLFA